MTDQPKTYTFTLPAAMAHAVMDALANNVTLHDDPGRFDFEEHFLDDEGTARPYDVYREFSGQLFAQGWGTPVTPEIREALLREP